MPSIPHYLALVDGYELFAAKGFKIKVSILERSRNMQVSDPLFSQPGAAVKFNQYSRESCEDVASPRIPQTVTINIYMEFVDTDFSNLKEGRVTWNVVSQTMQHFLACYAEERSHA